MKTIWQTGRAAFARALRGGLLRASRAPQNQRRLPSKLSFAASAILLLSFGVAQAQTAKLTPPLASTTTTVTSSQNPSTFGQSVTFTATVSGAAGTPTGTVTFLDGGSTIGTGTLGGGVTTFTTSTLAAGNHAISASYGGDLLNAPSNGSLTGDPQVVTTASTTTSLTSSQNPSTFGQSVTFTATVTSAGGTPTGTVTFLDGASSIGTGTLSGGQATFATSTLTVGSHTITASYGGDGNFGTSTGSLTGNPQVVARADPLPTTTSLTSSQNPSTFGQSVSFTATVTSAGGTPTGTVTFLDGGSSIGTGTLSGGQATFATSTLTVGNHTITANYGGDGSFGTSTGSLNTNPQVVNMASSTTALTSSQNPSTFGQPVTFTATVSGPGGTPTGTVTFTDGSTTIGGGPVTLSGGVATISTAALAVGSHTIKATYNGDSNFASSNTSLTQTVNQASSTTALTSSSVSSTFGQSVMFTATVSGPGGTPTGTVTFTDGSSTIGSPVTLSGGVATISTAALAVGSHTIKATYNGDSNFTGSNASLTQTVNQASSTTALTSSSASSTFGQPVTFTATVSGPGGTPTGTVTFTDGSTTIGGGPVTLSGGVATISTAALAVGSHTIKATYNGDSNFASSNASLTQTVNQASSATALTSSSPSSTFGQSVTFTATVSSPGGTPTGTVTFTDGSTTIGGGPVTLSGGVATISTAALAVGSHTIKATYNGDSNFASSNTSLTQTVNQASSTTALTSSSPSSTFGQSVTFTATVSGPGGTPTGTVTFTDGSTTIGSGPVTLSGGVATISTAALAVGSHTIKATYNGDSNFASSNTSLTQTVNQASSTTALTSSSPSSTFGQSVMFTATVSGPGGTPTGTVTFTDGSTTIGSPVTLSGGVATISTAALAVGSHTIKATYNGDSNFASSNASLSQGINQSTTGTTLVSSPNPSAPGQAVTFTATVRPVAGSGTPTGTVTFKDGGSTIGSGTLSGGVVTLTTSALSNGSHSITAVYAGDANFAGSTSSVLVQAVNTTNDSAKLRQMQVSTTPTIAQASGQAIVGAIDDAISAGFGGNPQALSPAGTGFTYYFTDDPPAQRSVGSDQDFLKRFLAAPNSSTKRFGDDFGALGYAGGMPTKAPPPAPTGATRDWLAWVSVRGTDFSRTTAGSDLKGNQINALVGLTRRITPDFLVGVLGGYERFDYSSQAFNGVLKGDGWTAGAYLGWRLAANLRFDAAAAWSDILVNDVAGTATANFTGSRWLANAGLTGTYPWQKFVLEPSARVFALWEHENAYTDSLGTFQPARSFETGRASAGVKAIYPLAWTSSVVALSPYAGLYADYYFSRDDAQTAGLTTVPLLQGWSARLTGGVAATLPSGVSLGAGGEFGGIGSANHIWTWTARGRIPF